MMKRLQTVPPSKVDKALNQLNVGDFIPVTGSLSHWRNRQANYHSKNPDAWVRIRKNENDGGHVAERLA